MQCAQNHGRYVADELQNFVGRLKTFQTKAYMRLTSPYWVKLACKMSNSRNICIPASVDKCSPLSNCRKTDSPIDKQFLI